MSRFRLGLAMAVLLLLILIIMAPARLLGMFISSDVLVMQGFSGSLWRGSAARVLVAAGHGYVHLGGVKWRLKPLSLLILSPTVDLDSRWGKQNISGQFTLRDGADFDIQNLEANISAQILRQFVPFLIEGRFSLQLAHLQIRDGLPLSGKGRVLWQDAAWLSPQGARPLGSYALDFDRQKEQAIVGKIVTVTGPVNAAGDIQLQGRNYAVDILLESPSLLDVQLQEALTLFAQPVGETVGNAYHIQLSGEF